MLFCIDILVKIYENILVILLNINNNLFFLPCCIDVLIKVGDY